jgi:predicted esterase
MHGYGSNEHDLFSFADYLHDDFLVVSVRAPYSLQPMGYAWYAIHFDQEQGKWSDDNQAKESMNENITELQPHSTSPDVFVAHGTLDEVVPYDWGMRSVKLLEENGIKPKVSFEPVGHTLGQKGFQALLKWHERLRSDQG